MQLAGEDIVNLVVSFADGPGFGFMELVVELGLGLGWSSWWTVRIGVYLH